MAHIDEERMSDFFIKYHLRGPWEKKIHPVIHHFTDTDRGDPHDHPWSFQSLILSGWYEERVYTRGIEGYHTVYHGVGDSFFIDASHIHQITALPEEGCYTIIVPQPGITRKSGFWQFREDGDYHRKWDSEEWTLIQDVNESV